MQGVVFMLVFVGGVGGVGGVGVGVGVVVGGVGVVVAIKKTYCSVVVVVVHVAVLRRCRFTNGKSQ